MLKSQLARILYASINEHYIFQSVKHFNRILKNWVRYIILVIKLYT